MNISGAPDSFTSKLPAKHRPKGWMSADQAQEKFAQGEEKKLQKLVGQWLNLHGIYFRRNRMDKRHTGSKGEPDFIVCYKGRFVALECKTHWGRLSEEQGNECARIRKNGGFTFVVTCREDFQRAFKFVDESINEQESKTRI